MFRARQKRAPARVHTYTFSRRGGCAGGLSGVRSLARHERYFIFRRNAFAGHVEKDGDCIIYPKKADRKAERAPPREIYGFVPGATSSFASLLVGGHLLSLSVSFFVCSAGQRNEAEEEEKGKRIERRDEKTGRKRR